MGRSICIYVQFIVLSLVCSGLSGLSGSYIEVHENSFLWNRDDQELLRLYKRAETGLESRICPVGQVYSVGAQDCVIPASNDCCSALLLQNSNVINSTNTTNPTNSTGGGQQPLEPVNCQVSSWGQWSNCTNACGEKSEIIRTRFVIQPSANGGEGCPSLEEKKPCPVLMCASQCPEGQIYSVNQAICVTKGQCCNPTNCQYTPWTQFEPCPKTCGGAYISRTRAVNITGKDGGKLCEPLNNTTFYKETKKCALNFCTGNCTEAEEYSVQAKSCVPKSQCCSPTDCKLTGFGNWTVCNAPKFDDDRNRHCGGGSSSKEFRFNVVLQHASNGGFQCPQTQDLQEERPCGRNFCSAQGCTTGNTTFSVNSKSCLQKTQCCSPQDCKLQPWSDWTQCSLGCGDGGGGTRHRTQQIEIYGTNGGKWCPLPNHADQADTLIEMELCNKDLCELSCGNSQNKTFSFGKGACINQTLCCNPQDCKLENFEDKTWTTCSSTKCVDGNSTSCPPEDFCGGGYSEKTRNISSLERNAGDQCPDIALFPGVYKIREKCAKKFCGSTCGPNEQYSIASRMCVPKTQCCSPVDCVYNPWSPYTACPVDCGGAYINRTRSISVTAANGGFQCLHESVPDAYVQKKKCALNFCPGNCTETQQYSVQTKTCVPKTQCCSPVDCVYNPWTPYTTCPVDCGGAYINRTRSINVTAANGGFQCLHEDVPDAYVQKKKCALNFCPGNCTDTQQYSVQTKTCVPKTQCCSPVDCEYSPFSNYTDCPVSCGGAFHYRTRNSTVIGTNGGEWCVPESNISFYKETKVCGMKFCPEAICDNGDSYNSTSNTFYSIDVESCLPEVDCCSPQNCVFYPWTDFTTCDAKCIDGGCTEFCGGGQRNRTRSVNLYGTNGGKFCPVKEENLDEYQEVSPCGMSVCGANCTSATAVFNTETKQCVEKSDCCNPVDCQLSDWAPYSNCTKECGIGSQNRDRTILTHPLNNGLTCSNSLTQVSDCNIQCCYQDCKVGNWSEFNTCSRKCVNKTDGIVGFQYRDRNVTQFPLCGAPQNECGYLLDNVTCNNFTCPEPPPLATFNPISSAPHGVFGYSILVLHWSYPSYEGLLYSDLYLQLEPPCDASDASCVTPEGVYKNLTYRNLGTFFEVTNLQPVTSYTFMVISENIIGDRSDGAFITLNTTQPKPAGPENLTVSSFNTTAVHLTWDPPQDQILPIKFYTVFIITHASGIQGLSNRGTFTDLEAVISGLLPDTDYEFVITGNNGIESNHSNTVNVLTDAVALETLAPVYLLSLSEYTLEVGWDLHVTQNISDVEKFVVTMNYTFSNGTEVTEVIYEGTDLQFEKTGLTFYTDYSFTVAAENRAGLNTPSDLVTFTTWAEFPDPPTGLTSVSNQLLDNQMALTWTAPLKTGGPPISFYEVWIEEKADSTNFDFFTSFTVDQRVTRFLEPAKTYVIYAFAATVDQEFYLYSSQSSTIEVTTKNEGPTVLSFTARDPDNGDFTFSVDDVMTIEFSEATNQPDLATKADVDALVAFLPSLGDADYYGRWNTSTKLDIFIANTGTASPIINQLSFSVKMSSVANLTNAAETSAPSREVYSGFLEGDWGQFQGSYALDSFDVSSLQCEEDTLLPIDLQDMFKSVLPGQADQLSLTIGVGSGVLARYSRTDNATSLESLGSYVVTGSVDAVNAFMADNVFEYIPPANLDTGDSFRFELLSLDPVALGGLPTPLEGRLYKIVVTPINDDPVLTAPDTISAAFGVFTPVPGISVFDQEDQFDAVGTEILFAYGPGFVRLSSTVEGAEIEPGDVTSAAGSYYLFSFATYAKMNEVLSKIEYSPSEESLSLGITDLLFIYIEDAEPDVNLFAVDFHEVEVTPDCTNSPAPQAKEAYFSNTLDRINIDYEGGVVIYNPSNEDPGQFVCSEMFTEASLALLGEGPDCHLVGRQEIQISLGFEATINRDDSLTFIGADPNNRTLGIVRICQDSIFSSGQTIKIGAPKAPLTPIVTMSVESETIASCDGIAASVLVERVGSIPPRIDWVVSGGITGESAFPDVLEIQPHFISPESTTVVSAIATNFLGVSSVVNSASQKSVKKDSRPIPPLTISGGVEQVVHRKSGENLFLEAISGFSPCETQSDATKELAYSWIISPDIAAVAASARLSRNLVVPHDNITPGVTYTVTAKVCKKSDPTLCNSATTKLTSPYNDLIVSVKGGKYQVLGKKGKLVLDASESVVDPDNTAGTLTYTWKCNSLQGAKIGAECNDKNKKKINIPEGATFTIASIASGINKDIKKARFTLTVQKTEVGNVKRTAIVYTFTRAFVDKDPPTLHMESYGLTIIQTTDAIKVESILTSTPKGNEAYTWTSSKINNNAVLSNDTVLIRYPTKNSKNETGWAPGVNTIVVKCAQGTLVGEGRLDITVNSPPSGGQLVVGASTAPEFTAIQLSTKGWNDDTTLRNALEYQFGYINAVFDGIKTQEIEVPLSGRQKSSKVTVKEVPRRFQLVNGVSTDLPITFFLRVFDKDGGVTTVKKTITITEFVPANPKSFLEQKVAKDIGDEDKKGDGNGVVKGCGMVAEWMSKRSDVTPADMKAILTSCITLTEKYMPQLGASSSLSFALKAAKVANAASDSELVSILFTLVKNKILIKRGAGSHRNRNLVSNFMSEAMKAANAAQTAAATQAALSGNNKRRLLAVSTQQTQYVNAFELSDTSLTSYATNNFKTTTGEFGEIGFGNSQTRIDRLLKATAKDFTLTMTQGTLTLKIAATTYTDQSNFDVLTIANSVDGFVDSVQKTVGPVVQVIFKKTDTAHTVIADDKIIGYTVRIPVNQNVCPTSSCQALCGSFDASTGETILSTATTGAKVTTTQAGSGFVDCGATTNSIVIGLYQDTSFVPTTTTTTTQTTTTTSTSTTTATVATTTTTTTVVATTTTTVAPSVTLTFTPPVVTNPVAVANQVLMVIVMDKQTFLKEQEFNFRSQIASLVTKSFQKQQRQQIARVTADDVVITAVEQNGANLNIQFYVKNVAASSTNSDGIVDWEDLVKVIEDNKESLGLALGTEVIGVSKAPDPSSDDDTDLILIIVLSILLPIIIAVAIGVAYYYYRSYKKRKYLEKHPPEKPKLVKRHSTISKAYLNQMIRQNTKQFSQSTLANLPAPEEIPTIPVTVTEDVEPEEVNVEVSEEIKEAPLQERAIQLPEHEVIEAQGATDITTEEVPQVNAEEIKTEETCLKEPSGSRHGILPPIETVPETEEKQEPVKEKPPMRRRHSHTRKLHRSRSSASESDGHHSDDGDSSNEGQEPRRRRVHRRRKSSRSLKHSDSGLAPVGDGAPSTSSAPAPSDPSPSIENALGKKPTE
eukprot:Nk52_evm39s223 gene=Nk52_evmTU39s223